MGGGVDFGVVSVHTCQREGVYICFLCILVCISVGIVFACAWLCVFVCACVWIYLGQSCCLYSER